ncbi:UNVERIFIED_CONTAM: hypothetical protein RMT77_000129 [Armadillidium vulgare]
MRSLFSLIVFCTVFHFSVQEYKVVCYFTNWAWYREGEGSFDPSNIDPDLCTHINYAFATLDSTELIMKPYDTWADIDNLFYERVVAYKRFGIKVLISIGGWTDSAGDKYSRLVNDPTARANFNQNALEFIQKYNFDGLDIDWEYPMCWQGDCWGPSSDKDGFAAWIKELKTLFEPYGYLVTAAVSAGDQIIPYAYDVPTLSQYLDHINVMTYDYHGDWDMQTGHVSPLYRHPKDSPNLNSNYSINYWISQGADPSKLVLGIPMYGNSFTLADPNEHGLNAPSYGSGDIGPITGDPDELAYCEVCYFIINDGWTVVRDPLKTMGPYSYKDDQWVGFDDILEAQTKSEYIQEMGLGGAMIWALDLDDFMNRCECEPYPLLRTINRVLRDYPPPAEECPILGG